VQRLTFFFHLRLPSCLQNLNISLGLGEFDGIDLDF